MEFRLVEREKGELLADGEASLRSLSVCGSNYSKSQQRIGRVRARFLPVSSLVRALPLTLLLFTLDSQITISKILQLVVRA